MNFLKKLFSKTEEEAIKEGSVYHQKKEKKNKPKKEGPNPKEVYRLEKEKRQAENKKKREEEARHREFLQKKELKEAKEAEIARKEQLEEARRKREQEQKKIKEQQKEKVVVDTKVDLYGFEVDTLEQGQIIEVEILTKDRENYLVRSTTNYQEALLPIIETGSRNVEIGDVVEVLVYRHSNDDFFVSIRRHENKKALADTLSKIKDNEIVEGLVVDFKDPFFFVELKDGLKGKVFVRNIDNKFVREPEQYLNKRYSFTVRQKYENSHKIQFELDRRSILAESIKNNANSIVLDAPVEISEYSFNKGGLEFELNGIRGFVPMRELSHKYYESIEQAKQDITGTLNIGIVEVQERKGDYQLIGSIRKYQKSPWDLFIEEYKVNDIVEAKISKIERYGMFLSINDSIRGLLHNSDLSTEVAALAKKLKIGDSLTVKIKLIDFDKHQVNFTSDLNETVGE